MNYPKLFGTSGIRGDAEKLFTNEFCQKLGITFCQFLKKYSSNIFIAVAMDPRPSSQRIKDNLILALRQHFNILDVGVIPTPTLSYFAKYKKLAGGVMITGSHIQDYLNGMKFFYNGEEILKSDELEIENIFNKLTDNELILNPNNTNTVTQSTEAITIYSEMLKNLAAGQFSNLTIVIDAGNGTQSQIMPEVLTDLGIKIIKTNCDINKSLLSRDLESPEAYIDIVNSMKSNSADLGILYDSDGDRSAFITSNDQIVPTDISGSLIAKYQQEEAFVTPINSSTVVEKIGKKAIRCRVGSPPVIEMMKKNGVHFGFESSGGTINGEIHYTRDAGITTIKILKIIRQTNKSLLQLMEEFPKYYTVKEKVECPSNLNEQIITKAKEKYRGKKIEDLDGVKIWIDSDSWILFRPSGNAPEFRVFSEALELEKAQQLSEEGLSLVRQVINNS